MTGVDEYSLFPTFSFFLFGGEYRPCYAAALGTCLVCLYGESGLGSLSGPQKPTNFRWSEMHFDLSVDCFFHLVSSSFH